MANVEQKKVSKVIIDKNLEFDGWKSTTKQLHQAFLITYKEIEKIKRNCDDIVSLNLLKFTISQNTLTILPHLLRKCVNIKSLKLELEMPKDDDYLHFFSDEYMNNNDNDNKYDFYDVNYDNKFVTEQAIINHMIKIYEVIKYLVNLENIFIRLIDFPKQCYKDYISLCFNKGYNILTKLKHFILPIDHVSIMAFIEKEYCDIILNFVKKHTFGSFTLILDCDPDIIKNDDIVNKCEIAYHKFSYLMLDTLYKRENPLKNIGIHFTTSFNVNYSNFAKQIIKFFAPESKHLKSLLSLDIFLPKNIPTMKDIIKYIATSESNLIRLKLQYHEMSSVDESKLIFTELKTLIDNNTNLGELYVNISKRVAVKSFVDLVKSIKKHPTIYSLEISDVQITYKTWNSLLSLLKTNIILNYIKIGFEYQAWHKIIENKKQKKSKKKGKATKKLKDNNAFDVTKSLFENQKNLYDTIKTVESCLDTLSLSKFSINTIKSYLFNTDTLNVKYNGLSFDISKRIKKDFIESEKKIINNDNDKIWFEYPKRLIIFQNKSYSKGWM